MSTPLIYAIISARSGSKGIPNKNIKPLAGKPLIAYSIEFAKKLEVSKVICSTDSDDYRKIAESYGAEVPFLRSTEASHDTAMEEDILVDLYDKFDQHKIPYPDLFVWLRPTFVFRDLQNVQEGIQQMIENPDLTAYRTICESESRLYYIHENLLVPGFEDEGKSMIRRQDVRKGYKVYSTDIFRGKPKNCGSDFLGTRVGYVIINKICGLDIDDIIDFKLIESLIQNYPELVRDYL